MRGSSRTSVTDMVVARERISAKALGCEGARCCTNTNAMPVSTGSAPSSCLNASRPPAEAPIPTIGKNGWSSSATLFPLPTSEMTGADSASEGAVPVVSASEDGSVDILGQLGKSPVQAANGSGPGRSGRLKNPRRPRHSPTPYHQGVVSHLSRSHYRYLNTTKSFPSRTPLYYGFPGLGRLSRHGRRVPSRFRST